MRWPWQRDPDPVEPIDTGGTEAKERAQAGLDEARALWPEVNQVAGSLRELRRKNGFTEVILNAMGVKYQ